MADTIIRVIIENVILDISLQFQCIIVMPQCRSDKYKLVCLVFIAKLVL